MSAVLLTAVSVSGYAQLDSVCFKQVDTTKVDTIICRRICNALCDSVCFKQVDTTKVDTIICRRIRKALCDSVCFKQVDTTKVDTIICRRIRKALCDSVCFKQVDTTKVDTIIRRRIRKAHCDSVCFKQVDTTKVDTVVFVPIQKAPCDTVCFKQVDTTKVDTVVFVPIQKAPCDTVCLRTSEEIRDSLRTVAPAIGINLAWAGIATPNISFEMPIGQHFSVGLSGGFKPGFNHKTHAVLWPRWSPLDHDSTNETKWPHLAVLPHLRWWPNEVFRGFFLGADLIYSHYNIGGIHLPLGIYPDIGKYRVQGDFYGAGLHLGYSVWLTRHLNLVLSAGALGGYKNATRYECPWCGAEVGKTDGLEVVPKLDISIAYHLFNLKREEKREEKKQNKR